MANANIFQQYLQQPKSVLDYSNDYAKTDALNNQNALQSLNLQQQQAATAQSLGERNALQRIAGGWNADTTPEQRSASLRNSGLPGLAAQADAYDQTRAKLMESTSIAGKNNADAAKTNQGVGFEKRDKALTDIASFASPQDALTSLQAHAQAGDIDPVKAQAIASSLQAIKDPGGFAQWQVGMLKGILTPKDNLDLSKPAIVMEKAGDRLIPTQTNSYAPGGISSSVPGIASIKIGQSPDNAATIAGEDRRSKAGIAKDFAIAGLDANGNPINGAGLLDEPTIANAAARYNTDGTLPPNLGRGQQGQREIASILKEASVQAAARGDTPEAQRVAQLANKANAAALNKLQSQQTMVGAFEKNFNKNADMAEQLSSGVDRTGSPLVNSWINAGKRAVTGDPQLSAFDASVKATVNEYAKIVSGGSGGGSTAQGEIGKIEGLLSSAQNAQQVKAVLDLMRKETANRMAAFNDEKSQLTSSMIRPNVKPVASPAAAAGWKVDLVK